MSREELRQRLPDLSQTNDLNAIISTIEPLLHGNHSDHWLLVQLAAAYCDNGDYDHALIRSAEAMWIEYDCPLARWVFAYALLLRGQFEEAVDVLEELIQQTPGKIAHGECGRGSSCAIDVAYAERIINDARLIIGAAYAELGYRTLCRFYLNMYKRHVEDGCDTVFPEDMLEQLAISE